MAKITIDLPDEIERGARNAARRSHTSISRWIAAQIAEKLNQSWPPEFLAALGSCPDFPDQEELRSGYGQGAPRESID